MWRRLRRGADALVDHVLLLLLHPQAEGDVVVHLHVREDRVALEDHRDPPPPRRQVGGVAVADVDASLVDPLETREAAQQRRLAAAGGTEQHDELPVLHLEVDAVDGREVAEGLAHALEADVSHALAPLSSRSRSCQRATRPQVVSRYLRMMKMTTSAGASRKKPPARR